MNNKVLVNLIVPEIGQSYDLYLPINKKIGGLIKLINQAISEFNGIELTFKYLYDADSGECFDYDVLLANTSIRNGTRIVVTR